MIVSPVVGLISALLTVVANTMAWTDVGSGKNRTYFVAVVEEDWDYMPR